MAVEVAVLRRDDRLLEDGGDVGPADRDALLELAEHADLVAVDVVDVADLALDRRRRSAGAVAGSGRSRNAPSTVPATATGTVTVDTSERDDHVGTGASSPSASHGSRP